MGTDSSQGGKPATGCHPVQGSTYMYSLHAKETSGNIKVPAKGAINPEE